MAASRPRVLAKSFAFSRPRENNASAQGMLCRLLKEAAGMHAKGRTSKVSVAIFECFFAIRRLESEECARIHLHGRVCSAHETGAGW